jgi:hypothetical protein
VRREGVLDEGVFGRIFNRQQIRDRSGFEDAGGFAANALAASMSLSRG